MEALIPAVKMLLYAIAGYFFLSIGISALVLLLILGVGAVVALTSRS